MVKVQRVTAGDAEGAYWRLHWSDLPPFNAENACSREWGTYGTDEECQQVGYSCLGDPWGLVRYFRRRTEPRDMDPVVVFLGSQVGSGADHEPLVIPSRVLAWLRWADLLRLVAVVDSSEDVWGTCARELSRYGTRRLRS